MDEAETKQTPADCAVALALEGLEVTNWRPVGKKKLLHDWS